MLENPLFSRPTYGWLWVVILLKTNHKPMKFMWNGEVIVVHEGQFITGRKELSKVSGIPESTIEDILNMFERQGQIRQQKTTKFRLITVINWKKYQLTNNKATTKQQQSDTNNNDNNENNDNKNTKYSDEVAGVQEVMEVFAEYNPTINWGNKTTRKAAASLIKQFGLEGTVAMAKQVISVQGKKYAPVAVTPYQMKEKLAQFKAYFEAEKNKKPTFTKIS